MAASVSPRTALFEHFFGLLAGIVVGCEILEIILIDNIGFTIVDDIHERLQIVCVILFFRSEHSYQLPIGFELSLSLPDHTGCQTKHLSLTSDLFIDNTYPVDKPNADTRSRFCYSVSLIPRLAVSFSRTISGLSAGLLRLSRPIQLILKFLLASLAATFESPDNILRRDFL